MMVLGVAAVALALVMTPPAAWRTDTVGRYQNVHLYEVKVGAGRNDGVQRVYVGCMNGHVIEWTYGTDGWTMVDCGATPTRIISIWLGDGRNDGLNRIYSACDNGHIYEFEYNSGNWTMKDVGSPGSFYAGVTIGAPRNDDTSRVVASGQYSPVREYSWQDSVWQPLDVSPGNRSVWPSSIGPGRNDGIDRIYCPDRYRYYLLEYSWSGASYAETLVSAPRNLVKTVVGDSRNDGVSRVYASGESGHVYEFSHGQDGWQVVDICPHAPLLSRYGLAIGRLRRDQIPRLYSTAQRGAIREHFWDRDSWADVVIDAVTRATADLTVGRGRNDDTWRLYAASVRGYLFEFTDTSQAVGLRPRAAQPVAPLSARPNPFLNTVAIEYNVTEACHVTLSVHNLLGVPVRTLCDSPHQPGRHVAQWDGADDLGATCPPGVYFCRAYLGHAQACTVVARCDPGGR